MGDENLSKYIRLIGSFANNRISATQFEREYLDLFKLDPTIRPEPVFLVLDKLFSSVDAFCANPEIRDEDDLTEEQLRAECIEALAALEHLLATD